MSGFPQPTPGTGGGNAILVEAGAASKVSGFGAAGALTGAELLPLVQGGADVRSTVSAVAATSAGNTAILVESGAAAKISALGAAGALAGTEAVPIVQAGATDKSTVAAIAALAPALLVESGAGAKISALAGAAALAGTELVPVVQTGADVQTTAAAIAALASTTAATVLNLTAAPANQGYSGIIMNVTYGVALVPGDLVYFASDGTVKLADSNSAGTFPLFALALATASSGSHPVLLFGTYRDDARYNWGTVGGLLWLSETAGEMTQTQPSASGDAIQPLGFAITADIVCFRPDLTWLTHV